MVGWHHRPNVHEIKRRLLLGKKVTTNLDSIFKSRYITLPTKVCLVKAMVFPVVMYGCESWIVKKAECRRIDAFELRCWRRLLRVPWTARRSNQSILKAQPRPGPGGRAPQQAHRNASICCQRPPRPVEPEPRCKCVCVCVCVCVCR